MARFGLNSNRMPVKGALISHAIVCVVLIVCAVIQIVCVVHH